MKSIKNAGLKLLATGLLLISAQGCMVGPGDQQIFEGRTESIPFSGFTVHPGQKIELFAKHPSTQNWVKIGETESTKDPYDYFDTKWYYW